MIKVLLPLCVIFFIVLYMAFAFVNWDIAWVAHVDVIARWFFILLFVAFFLVFSAVYLETKDK
nr:MAG TPA: Gamma-aminobutyric acid receptor subunit alpha-1, PTX, Membrane, Channel, Nanobody [Caudoviricetes sp.]